METRSPLCSCPMFLSSLKICSNGFQNKDLGILRNGSNNDNDDNINEIDINNNIGKDDAIDSDSLNYRNNLDNQTDYENNDNDDDHS